MTACTELPMFPLGNPLLPHMVLPLHVFEPRYRAMMQRIMATDEPEFGVVMIERGHEVGGGEVRSRIGTVARVVDAEEQEDGRWLVVGIGLRRMAVDDWLPDDPYPLAQVHDLPDEPGGTDEELASSQDVVASRLARVLALASELGHDLPQTELDDDPTIASYQASILAPLSAFDQHRLLATDSVLERLDLLDDELEGLADVLQYRLSALDED